MVERRRRADQASQGGPRHPAPRGPARTPRPQKGQGSRRQGSRPASTRQTVGQRRLLCLQRHPAGGREAGRLVNRGPAQGRGRSGPHLWEQGAARRRRRRAGGGPLRAGQRGCIVCHPAWCATACGAAGGCWPLGGCVCCAPRRVHGVSMVRAAMLQACLADSQTARPRDGCRITAAPADVPGLPGLWRMLYLQLPTGPRRGAYCWAGCAARTGVAGRLI